MWHACSLKSLFGCDAAAMCTCASMTSVVLLEQALHSVLSSWVSRRFFGGCAVLFPMVITVYITWWFLTFFDNFFSVRRGCKMP